MLNGINGIDIDDLYLKMNILKEEVYKNTNSYVARPYTEMIKICTFLNPQKYGCMIEKKTQQVLNYSVNKASLDKGDFFDPSTQTNWEFKASIISTKGVINVVQIRPWQDIQGYLVHAIDTRSNVIGVYCYTLSKDDMNKELEIMGSSNAHGTKVSTKNHDKIEKRFSFKTNSAHFHRWEKYRDKKMEAKLLSS